MLVTGSSGGIGSATARAFAEHGAALVLHFHTQRTSVETLRRELSVPAAIIGADLRDEAAAEQLFVEAVRLFPRIDALVVNAGIWCGDAVPLHEMSLAQWRTTLDADLTSAFLTCRAYLRHLAAAPREAASIVLVGSTAALFGEADHADYSAAKAGLVYGLTRSLKNEIVRLAPRGRVNCVCPGWTHTPMAEAHVADAELMHRVYATIPMQKIATPEDVAAAIVFLSSDKLAGHLSGTILPIAGGMEGRLLNP